MFLVHIGLIFCGITIHVFLIFSLCILHIVQGTQSIDKLLSPIKSKIFLTDGKGVIHGLVQPQLENEDEVFDVLVDIRQVFRNVFGYGLVAVFHVRHEYIQIIVLFGQDSCNVHTEYFVCLFCHVGFGSFVAYRFTLRQQGGLEIEQRKNLQGRIDKNGALCPFRLFQEFAEFGVTNSTTLRSNIT